MSIKPLLNSNSKNNKSLNLFSNQIEVNNVNTPNIDTTTINNKLFVHNPLIENLKLDGFSIIEEIASLSPSLNIDQLDNTKDIKLKIAGISKVDVKNNEIQLNENLNLNNKSLLNAYGLNTQYLLSQSQIETSLLVGILSGSLSISSNDLTLTENNLVGGEYMNFNPTQITSYKHIDMNNNDILNVSDLRGIGSNNHINMNPSNQMDIASGIIQLISTSSIQYRTTSFHIFRINNIDKMLINSSQVAIKNAFLNLENNYITNVSTINGLSVNGGLFTGTSNSNQLTTSTTEQSILPLTLLGSNSVPSNGFKVGDSYRLKLTGNFSSNNGDNLIIRLKGGVSSSITLATETISLNSSTNVFFNIDVDFNIRAIGVAGTAELVSSFNFVYNQQSGGNYQGQLAVSIENTNFDTLIQNDLDITAEFSSASANNSIETIHGVLHKVY